MTGNSLFQAAPGPQEAAGAGEQASCPAGASSALSVWPFETSQWTEMDLGVRGCELAADGPGVRQRMGATRLSRPEHAACIACYAVGRTGPGAAGSALPPLGYSPSVTSPQITVRWGQNTQGPQRKQRNKVPRPRVLEQEGSFEDFRRPCGQRTWSGATVRTKHSPNPHAGARSRTLAPRGAVPFTTYI